jgi:hypothetical protein
MSVGTFQVCAHIVEKPDVKQLIEGDAVWRGKVVLDGEYGLFRVQSSFIKKI